MHRHNNLDYSMHKLPSTQTWVPNLTVFKINWSRFANITLKKWSATIKGDGDPIGWVLQ